MSEKTGQVHTSALINQIIRTRRSVFTQQFDPSKLVPDAIIWEALENANWAPNHKFTEPWRFTVFTGKGLEKLAEQQAAIYKEFAGAKFKQNKYESLQVQPQQCSHVIAVGCKRHKDQLPEMEEIAAVACAVQNIYLTITAHDGVGCYWSTGGITFMDEAKDLFGLNTDDIFMGFLFVGAVKVPSAAGKRGAIQEKVKWISE